MIRRLLPLLAIMAAGPVAAQSLLALPDGEGTTFWNTQGDAPEAVHSGVDDGQTGTCYTDNGSGQLVANGADLSCLTYLVRDAGYQTGGAPRYSISGTISALPRALSPAFRGFAVTDVEGVTNCGERGDCDRIYIAGVATQGVLSDLAEAVRTGQAVDVSGDGVWNLESIDIVIDAITPLGR